MKLKIADDLSLPMMAVTEVIGFLGRRGQGKSYAAQKMAELMHDASAQFVVLDPVGNWYGLRLDSDGKKAGIPIPVFGGLRGDVPLEPTAGKLIADVIADRGISAVLDVSQFESDADKARFAHDFGARFYYRRKLAPSAVHLFLEECQEFVPQNPMGEEKRVLHVFQRIAKLGRNYGIGLSLISQRPQEVHKKVLNLTELLFVFQLTGPHERKAVEGWIQEKGIDEDIAAELPKLERGAPHAWSPAWLKISEVVHIAPKRTFDASSTPAVGEAAAARELAPIDLERLRKDMAATIEKAKAEDPRELRKQLASLKAELAKKPTPQIVKEPTERVTFKDRFVLKDGQIDRVEKAIDKLSQMCCDVLAAIRKTHVQPPLKPIQIAARALPPPPRTVPVKRNATVEPRREPQQRILNSLGWWEAAGVEQPSRHQVAFVARYSVNGNFNNLLGSLRTDGLIDYPSGGCVGLTDAGRALAESPVHQPTRDELIDRVLAVLRKEPQRRIFSALVDANAMLSREELASRCRYSVNGNFNNLLGSLRTLGVIQYPQGGHVALSELFDTL